ncbi:hypothetical protein [Hymenobacter cavernae]|uniref:Uncharacterized protein n=1 Tax=Hymenobacter cavernae TaxID=2044852 RepID=A0ABQ1UVR9_9BACT|nr:hypothetical protein [Hymenobacter cavernae]GGF26307.1 hypothetical protein GCM10011383_42270 [Hymenobacter cavernae]
MPRLKTVYSDDILEILRETASDALVNFSFPPGKKKGTWLLHVGSNIYNINTPTFNIMNHWWPHNLPEALERRRLESPDGFLHGQTKTQAEFCADYPPITVEEVLVNREIAKGT